MKKKQEIETLKNIIRILYSLDSSIPRRFKYCNSINMADPQRNLPMALCLERRGILRAFPDWSGPTTQANVFERSTVGRLSSSKELEQILIDVIEMQGVPERALLSELQRLDEITISLIPDDLKEKEARKCYFLRLNLLSDFLKFAQIGKLLSYDKAKTDPSEYYILDFCTRVLNEFYRNYPGFVAEKEEYNPDVFRDSFLKSD